jgi:cold shock CspA family protein
MSSTTVVTNATHLKRVLGCVKWFNNKAGYGFITITNGEKQGLDIFVHHSSIGSVVSSSYKYLVQGEYVEFELLETTNSNHAFQAEKITGINGGKLMYESRNELNNTRRAYKISKTSNTDILDNTTVMDKVWNKVSSKRQNQKNIKK